MSLRTGEYKVTIGPDGYWQVSFCTLASVNCIKSGTADNVDKAEELARAAVEEHKVIRAESQAYAAKSRKFTLR